MAVLNIIVHNIHNFKMKCINIVFSTRKPS